MFARRNEAIIRSRLGRFSPTSIEGVIIERPHTRPRGHHRAWCRDPAVRRLDRRHGKGAAARGAGRARGALRRDPGAQRQPDERAGDRRGPEPEGDRARRRGRRQRRPPGGDAPRCPRHELARRQLHRHGGAGGGADARPLTEHSTRGRGDEGGHLGPQVLRRRRAVRQAARCHRLRSHRPRGGPPLPRLRDGGAGLRPLRGARGGRSGARDAPEPRRAAPDLRLPVAAHDADAGDAPPDRQGRARGASRPGCGS